MRQSRHRASGSAALIAVLSTVGSPGSAAAQADGREVVLAGSLVSHRSGPLFFDYEMLAFRGPGTETEVVLALSVDGSRVSPAVTSRGWEYGLRARVELEQDGGPAARAVSAARLVCTGRLEAAHGVPLYLQLRSRPGRYAFRLEVADLYRQRGKAHSVAEGTLIMPGFDTPGPVITALALASDSADVRRAGPAGALLLNPTHLAVPGVPPLIYFEVYGLQPGAAFVTDLTLAPTRAGGALDRLLRGPPRAHTIRYEEQAPSGAEPVRKTLRLVFEQLRPGPYRITAVVTDAATGRRSLPATTTIRFLDREASAFHAVSCQERDESS